MDHGTHVAGTVAAARNGTGIVGVAPAARIASVKVVNDHGLIYPEYAVCGFMWAGLRRMDVTNSSYYIDPLMYWCSDWRDQRAAKRAVSRAVAWSTRRGVTHVAWRPDGSQLVSAGADAIQVWGLDMAQALRIVES